MNTAHAKEQTVRVIHVGKYFPPDRGGMETYLRDLMFGLLERGIRSVGLVHHSSTSFTSTAEQYRQGENAIEVTRAGSWFRLLFTPVSPMFPWLLRRLIKMHRPRLLHLHLPNPSAFSVLLLPSARRLPWVIHWQSDVLTPKSSWALRLGYALYKPFESALLKRASRIIVTSVNYLDTSRTLAPFRDTCRVIPLGVNDRFSDNRGPDATWLPDAPLKVLAIGRLTHYKGFDTLLKAMTQLSHVRLDLVGDGEQLTNLNELGQSLGILDRVRFYGDVGDEEKDRLLQACDCLCLPSNDRAESFGLVLVEAMSAGKACVITDVPGSGMTWVVDANRTGLIVAPDNSAALGAALNKLDNDRSLLKELGTRGRKKYEKELTINASASAVSELYDDIESANP